MSDLENEIKVYILGSTGFIGSALIDRMPFSIGINREHLDESLLLPHSENKAIVINCLANRKTSLRKIDIERSNFLLPRAIFEINQDKIIEWIQLSSYYSSYKTYTGVDMNEYARQKDRFSEFLAEQKELSIHNFILPHIYSKNESTDRILSRLIKGHFLSSEVSLYDTDQIIPILKKDNLVNFLYHHIITNGSRDTKVNLIKKIPSEINVYIPDLISTLEEISKRTVKIKMRNNSQIAVIKELDWPTLGKQSEHNNLIENLVYYYLN